MKIFAKRSEEGEELTLGRLLHQEGAVKKSLQGKLQTCHGRHEAPIALCMLINAHDDTRFHVLTAGRRQGWLWARQMLRGASMGSN